MNYLREGAKVIILPPIFILGYLYFLLTGRTINISYLSFRFLFMLTNGKINDFLSRFQGGLPKESTEVHGIFNELTEGDFEHIVNSIRENGYYEFATKLPSDDVESLVEYAKTTPTYCLDITKKGVAYLNEKVHPNIEEPKSPRYQFDANDLLKNKVVRKLVFDQGFKKIASLYLKSVPILDIVTMWWSFPFNKVATSQAAQMYHFDMDRLKFIKFFIYLTDVHEENGPHCYVEGSHKTLPKELRHDGRFEDSELTKHYSEEKFKEFKGKKGSILAVDTRGLHKGKPLTTGKRLLFQIQFSNSLFGAPFDSYNLRDVSPHERGLMMSNQKTYQLIKVSE